VHVAYPFPPSLFDQIVNFLYQGNSSHGNLFIFSAHELQNILQEAVDLATILIITHLVLVTARVLSKSSGGCEIFALQLIIGAAVSLYGPVGP
jgi:hypothetical protein